MCELIAERLGRHDPDSCFTVGIFSVLDALADRPIEEVVDALPLSNDVVDGLVHRAGATAACGAADPGMRQVRGLTFHVRRET